MRPSTARSAAISSMLSARRPSPSAARASKSSAGSSTSTSAPPGPRPPKPRSGSASARRMISAVSVGSSARSTYTRARDSNALTTSKDGFSVVAPMNTSVPSSMYGRKVSCWVLLKRCTSSRNSTVRRPVAARSVCAFSTAARTSLMPAITADKAMNCASDPCATRRARVVFPDPGGPHSTIECRRPVSSATRSGLPGPSTCG